MGVFSLFRLRDTAFRVQPIFSANFLSDVVPSKWSHCCQFTRVNRVPFFILTLYHIYKYLAKQVIYLAGKEGK